MPTENMTCQKCGSAEVTEFKRDTYVCSHCEMIFKYIDPSKLTVVHSGNFCQCGNPVQALCGTCGNGVCGVMADSRGMRGRRRQPGGCEGHMLLPDDLHLRRYAPNRLNDRVFEGYFSRRHDSYHTLVAVPSGGYRFLLGSPAPSSHLDDSSGIQRSGFIMRSEAGAIEFPGKAIADGKLLPVQVDASGWASQYVTAWQIWGYLLDSHEDDPDQYVCLSCFAKVGLKVCRALANGSLCEDPFCGRAATTKCPCCQQPYCERCLFTSLRYEGWASKLGRSIYSDRVLRVEGRDKSEVLASIERPLVCVACYGEYLLSEGDLELIKAKDALTEAGRRRNDLRRREAAKARASAVSLRWKQQMEAGCQRSRRQLFPIVRG